jgi:hypothetical protein
MNVDSEKGGAGQKRKSDDSSTAEMMESLRNDLFVRFDAITAKLLEHDAHRAEVGAQLRELNAKTESATMAATKALEEVQNLKREFTQASRPVSEASTAPSMPSPARRQATGNILTPPRARTTPAPTTPPPLPAHERAPDDDGRTLLLGGFPRDTPENEMSIWLNVHCASMQEIVSKKPKYSKGSVALIQFANTNAMWKVLKNPPELKFNENRIWCTIPKTVEARERSSALSTMRKALAEFKPIDAEVTVLYGPGYIKCGNHVVGRINPTDHAHVELSEKQLLEAGITAKREDIVKTFTALRKTTMLSVRDVSDWS